MQDLEFILSEAKEPRDRAVLERGYDCPKGGFALPLPSDPQSLNRYAFVVNNPLKYVDPSGHDPDNSSCSYAGVGCGRDQARYDFILRQSLGSLAPKHYRLVQTGKGGIIDFSHAYPSDVINRVRQASNKQSGNGTLTIHLYTMFRQNVDANYSVTLGLSEDQIASVALGIWMHAKVVEEIYQSISLGGSATGFSEEDLPSDLIAFFAEYKGMAPETVIRDFLGGIRHGVDEEVHAIGNIFRMNPRNQAFKPIQGEWPKEFLDALNVKPEPPGGLWKFTGVDDRRPKWVK
jgi:hypothetical protein